jgi:hypothetical protein
MAKRIDIGAAPVAKGSRYPAPFDQRLRRRRTGDIAARPVAWTRPVVVCGPAVPRCLAN